MANTAKTSNSYMQSTAESMHLENFKSGSCAEEEMVTWLQYPLEYTVERGYCSELFGSLSSSYGKAKREHVNPLSLEGGETGAGNSTGPDNAEDALALGAGRVSGFVHPEGAEAFNKVKTRMQQTAACLRSGSSPKKGSSPVVNASTSLNQQARHHHKREPYNLHAASNVAFVAEDYSAYGASRNSSSSHLWSSVSYVGANEGVQGEERRKEAATAAGPRPHLANSQGGSEVQMRHAAQGSSYSLIMEDQEMIMKGSSFHAASAGNKEPVMLALSSKGRHMQETVDAEEVVLPSCSGGSQSSGALSAKETSSMGKVQKLEDYDYRSKNAEVDSGETSQLNKRRSKRSRVAESHNLSEKRRRNRINEKLKTLQELIPNSCKTDKASILDEAIEYLKALQSQLQMMSTRNGMRLPPVIMPAEVQHLQGVPMAPCHAVGIGLPLVHGNTGVGCMGMGLTQGIDGRSFQAFPTLSPLYNLTTALLGPSGFGSQPYPGMEVSSSEFLVLQQASAQEPYRQIQGVSNTEVRQHIRAVSKDG